MSNTAPSTTAPSTGIIVGVDTHKLTHAAVAISALGARLGAITIPVNGKGYRALKAWAQSMGPVQAFGIEGTGSYASTATRYWRSTAQTASCGVRRARTTHSTPKAPLVPCWPARPPHCQSPAPAR